MYRMDSFEPLVIGELENRCNAVPMAFSRGAYCIRHMLPDQTEVKGGVPEWPASTNYTEVFYDPGVACGGSILESSSKRMGAPSPERVKSVNRHISAGLDEHAPLLARQALMM